MKSLYIIYFTWGKNQKHTEYTFYRPTGESIRRKAFLTKRLYEANKRYDINYTVSKLVADYQWGFISKGTALKFFIARAPLNS